MVWGFVNFAIRCATWDKMQCVFLLRAQRSKTLLRCRQVLKSYSEVLNRFIFERVVFCFQMLLQFWRLHAFRSQRLTARNTLSFFALLCFQDKKIRVSYILHCVCISPCSTYVCKHFAGLFYGVAGVNSHYRALLPATIRVWMTYSYFLPPLKVGLRPTLGSRPTSWETML